MGDLSQIGLLEPSVAAVFLALARARAASARIRQNSVNVAVCTQCPSMPAAGTYLPTWINAARSRWLVM